jgi:hypothetical protein
MNTKVMNAILFIDSKEETDKRPQDKQAERKQQR